MSVALKKVPALPQVLYTTAALRGAIRDVLSAPFPGDRRVVLVAYVGGEAQSFLPDPKGLDLVCWLQPGATNALTLGRLKKRGAKLYKSEKLHMKVYWSSRKGCVICSANASGNALGGGGLIEVGVSLPPGSIDINRLWKAAKPDPISTSDLRDLANKTPKRKRSGSHGWPAQAPSFLDWMGTEGVQSWKLGWWDATGGAFSKSAKEKARQSYGITNPYDFLLFSKGQASSNEWFLAFDVRKPMRTIFWFNVDFIIKVRKDDKAYEANYPYQAIMLSALQKYEPPPFKLDRSFTKAFEKAVEKFGQDYFENLKDLTPTSDFINLINLELSRASTSQGQRA